MNWDDIAYDFQADKSSRYRHGGLDYDVMAHGYMGFYETRLKGIPVRNVLEIGVLEGCSLRLWKCLFPEAMIYGIDINEKCRQYATDRISISILNQGDPKAMKEFADTCPMFDFIVDDGSHHGDDAYLSLTTLWDKLNPGALYAIEDLGCTNYADPSKWDGWWEKKFREWAIQNGGTINAHPSLAHRDRIDGTAVFFIDKGM
jgi:2-polyprenyl-3-methyl-5-hydroxy-6-metoxy-1,4-benzoquinol methylase